MSYKKANDLYQKKTNWFGIVVGVLAALGFIVLIASM